MLTITPVDPHWLAGTPPERDLCAHAGVVLALDGRPVLDAGREALAVSTGALHLLRTLERPHTRERPVAEQLLPHCGHWMWIDASAGQVVNGGCPHGLNWWVHHAGDRVALVLPDGSRIAATAAEWRTAVVSFADAVDALYRASAPKVFAADEDAAWFQAMRAEWRARRAAASVAPPGAPR